MNSLDSTAKNTRLLPGEASIRRDRDREYLMSLTNDNLLRSHYLEAGLIRMNYKPEGIHWGWDSPLSDIRGTFCGHWLSAAAHMYVDTCDEELRAKADKIVSEIAKCQVSNGGHWAFPIPEKHLYWLKAGKHPWAPQYVCHKNMMGLLDMYLLGGNEQALEIVKKCADWFYDFTDDITRENMSDMMDLEETGGIMELWADLYATTNDEKHLALMRRYERPRLADPLLLGIDMLTNMHANATIPEMHGYARAYEVTEEERYRKVVEAYWDMAVEKRGTFATGGQTSGEIWTPMGQFVARLGDKNQEHCVVHNMMRLSDYLLRWTGDSKYADYFEKNLINGIYAQGFWRDETEDMNMVSHYRKNTTVTYYLPMEQGSTKHWGSELDHFWCCHCTLVQANAIHHEHIYYTCTEGIVVAQFIESSAKIKWKDCVISIEQKSNSMTGGDLLKDFDVNRTVKSRPNSMNISLAVQTDQPTDCVLSIRIPNWIDGEMNVFVNGQITEYLENVKGFAQIKRLWHKDQIDVTIRKKLSCVALPDDPSMVAFLDGPVCLAGLVSEEHLLEGDVENPENSLLCAADERQWQSWKTGWKTYHQNVGIQFKPLYKIGYEPYTIYFPVNRV